MRIALRLPVVLVMLGAVYSASAIYYVFIAAGPCHRTEGSLRYVREAALEPLLPDGCCCVAPSAAESIVTGWLRVKPSPYHDF